MLTKNGITSMTLELRDLHSCSFIPSLVLFLKVADR